MRVFGSKGEMAAGKGGEETGQVGCHHDGRFFFWRGFSFFLLFSAAFSRFQRYPVKIDFTVFFHAVIWNYPRCPLADLTIGQA